MRIAPIFNHPKYSSGRAAGQSFQKADCRKPHKTGNMCSYSSNDLFMRMAEASMRDKKLELELTSMELI